MNNFIYVTPTQLVERHPSTGARLEQLHQLANEPDRVCENCDELAWKYGGTGLCFSCTTGESDASGDYELLSELPAQEGG